MYRFYHQLIHSNPLEFSEKHDKKGIEINEVNPAAIHNDRHFSRMLPTQLEDRKLAGRCRSAKEEMSSTYIHPSIGEVNVSCSNVSAHMHTECDILPCPHRNSRETEICANERACPKQDKILRKSSYERPVEIAVPVVGLFASNGTTDCVDERRAEPNLDTTIDRLADGDRRFDKKDKRSIEAKNRKRISVNEQSSDISEQKEENCQSREFRRDSNEQSSGISERKEEKCPSREFRRDRTEKEGFRVAIDRSMQDASITYNDKKSKIAEAIDEVSTVTQ